MNLVRSVKIFCCLPLASMGDFFLDVFSNDLCRNDVDSIKNLLKQMKIKTIKKNGSTKTSIDSPPWIPYQGHHL